MKNGYPNHKIRQITDLKDLIKGAVSLHPDQVYLKYKNEEEIVSVTFSEFDRLVDALGTAFYDMGFAKKHIAVIGETSVGWIAAYLAAVNGGGVIIPLDKEITTSQIKNFLIKSDADAIVYAPSFHPVMEEIAFSEDCPVSLFVRMKEAEDTERIQNDKRFMTLDSMIDKGERLLRNGYTRFVDYRPDPESPAAILFTSGTTGTSKGVLLSQKNITTAINASNRMMHISSDDVLVSVLPIHHTYEMTCGILTPIAIGCTVCINDNLKYVLKNFQLFRPTTLVLVPLFVTTMYKKIWETAKKTGSESKLKTGLKLSGYLRRAKIDLRSVIFGKVAEAFGGRLKRIICGGAPLSEEYVRGFQELGINLVQGYGITECSPLISVCPFHWNKFNSVGLVIPGLEIMVEKGDGKEGEIIVRGDNVMMGYYKEPLLTAEVLDEDGWFRTGDIGYVDEDRFVYLTGRKKNVIVLENGKNVFPEEIEEYLYKNELIAECLVVGKESGGGIVLTAQIYPDFEKAAELSLHDVKAISERIKNDVQQLNKQLPSFKQIRGIEIRKTEFEKTTSKKIKRNY